MKNIYRILILVGIALITISCHKKSDKKMMDEGPRPVQVATPKVDSVTLYHEYPGMIMSKSKAEVVGRVNGQLLSTHFSGGQYVSKGQVLFTIESNTYRDAVNQASASLATAKSQLAYATQHYEAMQKALQGNAVSEMSVKEAESALLQAQAAVKSAEAQLHSAQTNLSYCTVTAPISGHISNATIDPGAYVSGAGSAMVLATIYDDMVVQAKFSVSAEEYSRILGQNGLSAPYYRNVPLTFKESLQHEYTADLTPPAPNVEKSTGTIALQGNIANDDNELKDGMFVSVSLPYGTNPKAILVNDASIGTDQLGKYVYVVNDSDKVVYTPIKTGGLYQDTLRIVESGLTPQSRYVTKALLTVRNGEKVKPVP